MFGQNNDLTFFKGYKVTNKMILLNKQYMTLK